MATQSIQATTVNLCKNEDCSPTQNDECTEKCSLCDGYFADGGQSQGGCVHLDDNIYKCSLCGTNSYEAALCKMKGNGIIICLHGCESDSEDEASEVGGIGDDNIYQCSLCGAHSYEAVLCKMKGNGIIICLHGCE